MPQPVVSNQALYIWIRDYLQTMYRQSRVNDTLVKTLAMMITGLFWMRRGIMLFIHPPVTFSMEERIG